jgi:heme o synthase
MKLSLNRTLFRLSFLALLAVSLLTFGGALVDGANCLSWPLCLPTGLGDLSQLVHRASAGFTALIMLALLVETWRIHRDHRWLLPLATVTVTLFFAQVFVGAIQATRGLPADIQLLHTLTAVSVWLSLAAFTVAAAFYARDAVAFPPLDLRQRLKDFLILTKPIIVLLLLVTTFAGMVMGGKAWPTFSLAFFTLLGGALAAGGSGAINQYIDRDLDKNMQRTAKRPMAAGRMTPAEGLAFGLG